MGSGETRQRIIEAADRLFYEAGFDPTSFADIAAAVNLSRGNFYYHFKTKDEILAAVIDRRLDTTRALLADWEVEAQAPLDRLKCFIRILLRNRDKIMLYGCPLGTLSNELAKLDHVSRSDARRVFDLFKDWLAREFSALGRSEDADALALRLLVESQGVATLANAYRDDLFIQREVDRICTWLDALTFGKD